MPGIPTGRDEVPVRRAPDPATAGRATGVRGNRATSVALVPRIRTRLAIALVVGVALALVPLGPSGGLARALTGFIGAGLAFAGPLLVFLMRPDGEDTRRRVAGRGGDTTWYDTVILVAAVASLFGVATLLIGSSSSGSQQVIDAIVGLLTVLVGWVCVHTTYILRYARIYYASSVAPIDFKQDEPPAFSDFAYFSFNLGMAYQIADTDLKTTEIRRVVLAHCLVSYLYGTLVIAATINLVAGIGGSGGH